MVGFWEFFQNRAPEITALGQGIGGALLAHGAPYMDPTEPHRQAQAALAGIPGAIQQARMGDLHRRAAEEEIAASEAARAAAAARTERVGSLVDYISSRDESMPGAMRTPGIAPRGAADPMAGGPALLGGDPMMGGAARRDAEYEALFAEAFPEAYAREAAGALFRPPREPTRTKLAPGEVLVGERGEEIARGVPKVEKGTTLMRNLEAAGIDPKSPEGRRIITDSLTKAATEVKITEGDKKAQFFAGRMAAASELLNSLEGRGYDAAGLGEQFRNITNWTRSSEGRRYRSAARQWLAPVLRFESGAQIPVEEFDTYYEMYFPIPGDDAATIRQKADLRRVTEMNMGAAFGGGAVAPRSAAPAAGAGARNETKERQRNKYLRR